ncbi:MAG: heat-inducible transcriptional repressor HrcA [Oscillospiraceae bacterium]|nr:heat-inducible transcriptional repressor HrcA [Oscillospiraceae bacterium]
MDAEKSLNERKQKLLCGIVEAYIRTGEPVGSKMLADLFGNNLSSATIRNEMADLAGMGYLDQPHTSAGRVPTAAAFRLYIDKWMKHQPLPEEYRRAVDSMLNQAATSPDKLMEQAAQALSEATGCAAVTTAPSSQGATVRRLELMRSSEHAVALIMMTSSGAIRSRVCRIDPPVSAEELSQIARTLSETFTGETLASLTLPRLQGMAAALGGLRCLPLLSALLELAAEAAEAEVLLAGQFKLLQHPAYEWETARALLNLLSQRRLLAGLIGRQQINGPQVVLGGESSQPELNGSSIIMTKYLAGPGTGSLGIIGPLRMDYAAAIPQLEYFARALGKLLGEWLD